MLAIIGMLLDRSARSRELPTACQPNSVFRENIPQGVRERPQCIGSAHLEEPSNPRRSWGTWSSVSRSANGCLQEGPYHLQGGEVCSRGPRFFFCCVALYPRKRTSHETSKDWLGRCGPLLPLFRHVCVRYIAVFRRGEMPIASRLKTPSISHVAIIEPRSCRLTS